MMTFYEMSELLEQYIFFDYIEYEGPDLIRHDWAGNSFWINKDGAFENLDSFPKHFQTRVAGILELAV